MRVFIYLVILAWVGLPTTSWGQKPSADRQKNTLEVFFPVSHFFDETQTNWGLVSERQSNYYYSNGELVSVDTRKIVPLTFGLQYTLQFSERSGLAISALWYGRNYNYGRDKQPGEVIERAYGVFSIGYLQKLYSQSKINLYALASLSYRLGDETIHIYYPNGFEGRVESMALKDWGISAGLRATYDLPWRFLLSAEAKYTRFVYLHDEGVDFFGDHEDPTPHDLTVKIGLGYRF